MKRTAAPQAPGQRGPSPVPKKPSDVSNGTAPAPAPLTYPGGEPTDDVNMNEVMAEEKVTLSVFLASGACTTVTVDSNIPMLDLLVHLAGRCKVSPAAHELQARDEESGKALEFKPNQTVGSLGTTTVHLLAKNRRPEWSQAAKASGKAAMAFEITQRFTINLPGGQKAVMRVSPQLTLGQVLAKVCQDKSLDTARYTLQHPAHPHTPLSLTHTIADSKLSEINLVHADNRTGSAAAAAAVPAQRPSAQSASMMAPPASSSVSASQDPASWYMPGTGETKKKKGFLSFLSKKEKKFKVDSHHNMETSSNSSSHKSTSALPPAPRSTTPPPPSDPSRAPSRADVSARRPHTMYFTSSSSLSPSPRDSSPREQLQDSSPRGQRTASPNLKGQPGNSNSPKAEMKKSPREQQPVAVSKTEPRAPPRGGGGKKRPAPPPPQAKATVAAAPANEEMVKATSAAPVAAASTTSTSRKQHSTTLSPANVDQVASTGLDTKRKTSAAAGAVADSAAAEVSVVVVSVPAATTVSSSSAPAAGGAAAAADVTSAAATANAASSLLHSRNSSDSSGYHELTLSGAESPEASHHHLPTAFKTSIDTTSIDSGDNLGNGDSGIQDISSPEEQQQQQQQQQGSGRGDLSKPQGVGVASGYGGDISRTLPSSTKKKKAPPPPPKAKPAPVQEETSELTVDETDHPCAGRPGTPALEAEEEEGPPSPPSTPTDEMTSEEPAAAPPVVNMDEEAPTSMKLNLDFLEESDDTETERTDDEEGSGRRAAAPSEAEAASAAGGAALTAPSATDSESKEAFDLDDILNSVVFDEEPRRTSSTHTPRSVDDDDDVDVEDSRQMAMMETASIVSEEVGVDVAVMVDDVRSRPCEFIAPPPPDEPPPEDYSPRGSGPLRSYADKSTVVGEDNVSLAPASLKGSPVSRERSNAAEARTSSDDLPSDATVPSPPRDLGHVTEPATRLPPLPDTLLKEETTTEVQQGRSRRDDPQPTSARSDHPKEASTSLHGHSEEEETLPAMGSASAFAMTEEISAPLETVPPPLQFQTEEDDRQEEEEEEEVVTVTEEYIIPLAPGGGLDFSAAVKVSEEEEEKKKKRSSGAAQRTEPISSRDASSSGLYDDSGSSRADGERRRGEASLGDAVRRQRDVQSVVQQDFVGSAKKKQEESATSFIRAEKEEKQQKDVVVRQREMPESILTSVVPRDFVRSAKKREESAATSIIRVEEKLQKDVVGGQGAPKQQKPAAEKEEFVLTLEDLSSVSLVPLRPKKYNPPRATSTPIPVKEKQQEEDVVESEASGSPQRRHLHLAYVSDHGHVQPARSSSYSFSSSTHPPSFASHQPSHPAKESSSSPRAPSPAASPRQEPQPEPVRREESSDSGSEHRYRATARLKMTPETSPLPAAHQDGYQEAQARSRISTGSSSDSSSPATQSVSKGGGAAGDLQRQYSSLQEQFSVWQQQLQQNQTLLAGQGGVSGGGGGAANSEDTLRTLQMQMQMQQQMMEQLQRSMQALALQQPQQQQQQPASATAPAAGRGASSYPQPPSSSGVQVTVTPPPPAAAPPAPPAPAKSVVRAPARKVTTQPLSSRFQPQLDPREELMIAIRSCGGISGLNTVPVSDTRWASGKH